MCLAIPGKVVNVEKDVAMVEYFGKPVRVNCTLMPCAPGDYVLVNGGFVIEKIPEHEALKTLAVANGKC